MLVTPYLDQLRVWGILFKILFKSFMDKIYLTTIILILINTFIVSSQTEYKTKSGHIYKIGDTIELGQPVKISSSPLIATTGEWATILNKKGENVRNMNLVNSKGIIEEIHIDSNNTRLIFKVFGRKFYVLIEEAIRKNEVVLPLRFSESYIREDKYDKIRKLKELLDIEAITKEEFDKEKKKLLDQ